MFTPPFSDCFIACFKRFIILVFNLTTFTAKEVLFSGSNCFVDLYASLLYFERFELYDLTELDLFKA